MLPKPIWKLYIRLQNPRENSVFAPKPNLSAWMRPHQTKIMFHGLAMLLSILQLALSNAIKHHLSTFMWSSLLRYPMQCYLFHICCISNLLNLQTTILKFWFNGLMFLSYYTSEKPIQDFHSCNIRQKDNTGFSFLVWRKLSWLWIPMAAT